MQPAQYDLFKSNKKTAAKERKKELGAYESYFSLFQNTAGTEKLPGTENIPIPLFRGACASPRCNYSYCSIKDRIDILTRARQGATRQTRASYRQQRGLY